MLLMSDGIGNNLLKILCRLPGLRYIVLGDASPIMGRLSVWISCLICSQSAAACCLHFLQGDPVWKHSSPSRFLILCF